MSKIGAKLHSQNGASMVLALMFLLTCLMISAVILMAASANADRTAEQRQEQREYLAASSALALLQEDSTQWGAYQGSETKVTYTCYQLQSGETLMSIIGGSCSSGPVTAFATNADGMPDGLIGEVLGEMAQTIAKSRTTYNAPVYYSASALTKTFTIQAENMPDAVVTMTMSDNEETLYDVDVIINVVDSPYSLRIPLEATATVSEPVAGTQTVSTTHGHVVRRRVRIGYSWYEVTTTEWSMETPYSITTTVTWTPGTVSKGGA